MYFQLKTYNNIFHTSHTQSPTPHPIPPQSPLLLYPLWQLHIPPSSHPPQPQPNPPISQPTHPFSTPTRILVIELVFYMEFLYKRYDQEVKLI